MALNYYVDPKTLVTRNWPSFVEGQYLALDGNHALLIGEEKSGPGMTRTEFNWSNPNLVDEAWDLQMAIEVWLCYYQYRGEAYRWQRKPAFYNTIEATGQQYVMCTYELQLTKAGAIQDSINATVKWRITTHYFRAFIYVHNRKIRIPRPIPPVPPEVDIEYWQGNQRVKAPVTRQLPRRRASLTKSTKQILDDIFAGHDESDAIDELQEGSEERSLQTQQSRSGTMDDATIRPTRVSQTGSKRPRYEDPSGDSHDGAGPSTQGIPRRVEGRTRAMREVVY